MNFNQYKDYSVDDFVNDANFIEWVSGDNTIVNKFWEDFFTKHPNQVAKAEKAKALLLDLHLYYEEEEHKLNTVDLDFEQHLGDLMEESIEKKAGTEQQTKPIYWIGAAMVAASLLFFFVLPASFWQLDKKNAPSEFVTGNGEWEKIILPDGSLVELNANSQLALLDNWESGKHRQVWLKGEAFFDIKKTLDSTEAFSVITKDLRVEVLGTAFQVNTRNQQTEVFLEEGKIRLNLDKEQNLMQAGDFVAYSQAQKKIAKTHYQTTEIHRHWREGVVTLKDASLEEIIQQLEVVFGIDVIVEDAQIKQTLVDGKVTIPVDNLSIATKILERVLDIQIRAEGKQLFFHQEMKEK